MSGMAGLPPVPSPEWVAALSGPAAQAASAGRSATASPLVPEARALDPQVQRLGLVHADAPSRHLYARDDSCALIFDGLLANREELALAAEAPPASEQADAALVLRLYRQWGDGFLTKLRGWYVVILWDAGRDLLLAARDAMGSIPLFYTRVETTYLFSTSVDALLRQPSVDKTLNRVVVAETLAHRYPATEETFYRSVRRVPPGHVWRQHAGAEKTHQYWDPAPPDTPDDAMQEADLEPFDSLLQQAVRRAMALGPVGIFLSGGLDSVSIAVMATDTCRAGDASLPLALSLAFPDPSCNEVVVQEGVAAELGLRQMMLPFEQGVGEQGLLAASLELSRTLAAPLQNPWRPAYCTLAAAGWEAGCRVILTGTGGDDWLTVNQNYMADLLGRGDLIGSYRFARDMLRSYTLPRAAMVRFLLWRAGLRPMLASRARRALAHLAPERLQAWRRRRLLSAQTIAPWLAPDPALREAMQDRAAQQLEAALSTPEPQGRYGFYNATSISRTFAHPLLTLEQEEDYAIGRRLGLWFAHPYWDPDLVSFLCRVPPRLLLAGGREKGLVRQAVARRFPGLAFERQRKVSASDFFYATLRSEAPAARRRLGALASLIALGIVDERRIEAVMSERMASQEIRQQHFVWELLVMEAWARPRL